MLHSNKKNKVGECQETCQLEKIKAVVLAAAVAAAVSDLDLAAAPNVAPAMMMTMMMAVGARPVAGWARGEAVVRLAKPKQCLAGQV